jgi:hypothetical protein
MAEATRGFLLEEEDEDEADSAKSEMMVASSSSVQLITLRERCGFMI